MKKIFLLLFISIVCTKCHKKDTIDPGNTKVPSLAVSVDSLFTLSNLQIKAAASSFGGIGLIDKFRYGVSVYKLTYPTMYKGQPIIASGLMYLPAGMSSPGPFLSVQHGTTFVKSGAPSVSKEFSGIEFYASAGYITFMPDYIGYGASSTLDHPYYDAAHAASAVIDMIKAGKEYLDQRKEIRYNSKLFLTGYSEGGYVTLATQKTLESNAISDLTLTAVAAGAGGYDLTEMLKNISTSNYYSYPAYLSLIVYSYNTLYDWNKTTTYFFRKAYADKLDTLLDGNAEGDYINSQLTTKMDSLFDSSFYNGLKGNGELQFKNTLAMNSLADWNASVPIRLYHGTNDEVIPYENSMVTYEKLKNKGANIELLPIEGATHGSGLKPMILSAFEWFETFN
jgi:pimeloyl-ACP methyl ester carboxylesterase